MRAIFSYNVGWRHFFLPMKYSASYTQDVQNKEGLDVKYPPLMLDFIQTGMLTSFSKPP
jgi:hypothetical protein